MELLKSPYRNALRSEKLICDAFMQLIKKKDVSSLKATEVILLAGVSKGTFYTHYNSVYALTEKLEDDYIFKLFDTLQSQVDSLADNDLRPLFEYSLQVLYQEREFFLLMFHSSRCTLFSAKIQKAFVTQMLARWGMVASFSSYDAAQGYLSFIAGGALSIVCSWLEQGCPISCQQLALFLCSCAHPEKVIEAGHGFSR